MTSKIKSMAELQPNKIIKNKIENTVRIIKLKKYLTVKSCSSPILKGRIERYSSVLEVDRVVFRGEGQTEKADS